MKQKKRPKFWQVLEKAVAHTKNFGEAAKALAEGFFWWYALAFLCKSIGEVKVDIFDLLS